MTLGVLIAGLILFIKGGGGVALSHLKDANDVLTTTVQRQQAQLDEQDRELSELRGRTDVSLAIASAVGPILEWSTNHETRAQDRHETLINQKHQEHERVMAILALIADRLGPDPHKEGDRQ